MCQISSGTFGSVASAIAIAVAVAGIAEARPDVLQFVTYVVKDDHQ